MDDAKEIPVIFVASDGTALLPIMGFGGDGDAGGPGGTGESDPGHSGNSSAGTAGSSAPGSSDAAFTGEGVSIYGPGGFMGQEASSSNPGIDSTSGSTYGGFGDLGLSGIGENGINIGASILGSVLAGPMMGLTGLANLAASTIGSQAIGAMMPDDMAAAMTIGGTNAAPTAENTAASEDAYGSPSVANTAAMEDAYSSVTPSLSVANTTAMDNLAALGAGMGGVHPRQTPIAPAAMPPLLEPLPQPPTLLDYGEPRQNWWEGEPPRMMIPPYYS